MRPDNFNVYDITEYLQGTSITLEQALTDHYEGMVEEDLTDQDRDDIDNDIFLCEDCGWWCEISEESEEEPGKCEDCANDY